MTQVKSNRAILEIRCSYCPAPLRLDFGAGIRIKLRSGDLARGGVVASVSCTACGSKTEILISTRRKGKGKGIRAIEATQAAELAVKVAEAEAENAKIALRLLAEPDCTCAAWSNTHGDRYEQRTDGLSAGGRSNGIPLPPRHRHGCPRR